MNWYKAAQSEGHYTDIGHEYGKNPAPNILWYIDEDWNLQQK